MKVFILLCKRELEQKSGGIKMAKLAEQLERKAFSAAIDVALRRINKDKKAY